MSDQRYIKEGWLMKRSRSGRVVSNWRRRYFRLTRTELLYYKTPQDTAPRRCYELTLDTSVLRTNDQGYPLCILFQPAPGQPSFYMQAENEVEKDEWITAIYNAYRRTPDVAQQTLAPEMPKEESAPSIGPTPPQPPAAPAPPSRILLKLVVEEARKLKAADFNGKSDPYCVVKLVGKDGQVIDVEEKRTEVIPATLEPAWRKPFEIGRVVDLNSVKAIRFDLFDHDTFKRHDSLGSVQVPFSRFRMSPASTAQSEPIDDWFRVEPPKKTGLSSSPRRNDTREKEHVVKDWGELRVQMSISGPNLVDFFHSSDLAFVPTSPVATASNEHTDNRLEVTVIAARDLISADLNNSSDPYCELSLLDDHGKPIPGEYATTAIMHRTRNPAWADEHHVFGLICHIEKAASLKVRVVDYDKSNRNDPLGFVHIGLDQLSAHKWTEWHVLQPEEGMSVRENLGAIQLKIWLIGERRGEHVRQLKIEKELNTKRHNISVEQLELENAQFQLHDAACKLDGARIPCAVTDYQARDPRFYGINGCIHYLNSQIPRAHQEKVSSDEGFQARAGLEGQAVLEVTVIEASDLKQKQKQGGDTGTTATPYAVIEIDPSVCVEGCKRTSAPLSPQKSKRIAAAASEARNTMFSKRSQAEVSLHRSKLVKNEMRSEKSLEVNPDKPVLKVEILTGHGLSPADMNGYSDPYCTLSITDQTGKAIDAEKKRTAVVSKTLNPVWTNENFLFGNSVPLSDAKSLLIHVKDHNNIGRSTPLGRVEIPLYDLCRASAGFTSISSKTVMKRYELKPEPWMKKHAKDLGELCIKTEVVGDATALAELMQRVSTVPMEKSLSILTFSEANIQSEVSMDMDMSATDIGGSELEDETTEVIQRGLPIQTSTSRVLGTTATWRKEKFALSLSYPGVFSDAKYPSSETHVLHLRVHEARNLLLTEMAGSANIGSSSLELDGVHDSQTNGMSRNAERAQDATNIYFTIIPVLGDGRLEDAERKQSLTVYNTRDPSWPEENFVFGKIKDIANVSYLSLHLYGRDLQNDQKEVLAKLLNHDEKKQDARLKRFQLHKLTPSGEVDDDGFEILQYGQRILAFRGGDNGGRFYPARVQKYIPFPDDVYDVHFEDEVDTIDELRNLISFDVKGAVQAVRSDGRVDVSVENELPAIANSARRTLRYTVKPTQLIPINSLTDKVEMVMARRFDMEKEEDERWLKLQHKFSGIVIDVLSASDLLVPVNEAGKPQKFKQLDKTSKPTCRITMLGNPKQVASSTCRFNKQGELIPGDTVTLSNWNCQKGEVLAATVLHGSAETDDVHLFQQKPLVMGRVDATPPGDTDYQPVEPHEIKMGYQILEQASSILIRVDNEDAAGNQTVGFVKVDLAMLQSGQQDLTLQIVPPDTTNVPYYKFVGSLFLRITTWSDTFKPRQMQASTKAGDFKPRLSVCGLSMWYQRQVKIEAQSSSILTRGVTWIERRQILRSSLTPTENCQIDEFHAVLVVIMKRIVSILREIRQFEEFEVLSADDMRKCRQVHTVNADPTSEWLGCTMDKLSLEARKEVVAGLENELLDLAGVTGPRIFPDADIPREEWVKLRADRQRLLRESGSFFMRDQTSALVLSVPRSFTGEGWRNANLEFDPDAIQAPTTREELSHQDHEKKSRELRAQVRRELKKPGCVGETVMAYYGKGKNLKSKPMQSGNFKRDSLYSGRIVRIRTPFTDPTYQFTAKYDISNKMEVPELLSSLLAKYKVTDKASWLSLPKAQRDMFLLYDVEYSHNNERIVEEGLMRELIRTSEGDLDPHKVSDRCTDLNILFKATDLENCVSRMVKHRYRHKPLGVLKIPIRMISPHRTVDAWYPLAPASDMLQKTRLGQIRVELKLVHKRDIKRSAKVPSLIEAIISEVSPPPPQEKNLTPKGNAERDPKKKIPFVVGLEPSFVKVSILEGRSLRVADLFTSDPFVEMVLIDDDSKERDTSLKTDIKMKTLNPKWENQEFLLGKTEKTMLRDKKALLLRVMDFDQTSANDPLGCVTIEFQRSETGYIRGVVLKQADALGGTIMQELTLDEYGRVEVEAMLLPATGQSKPKAKKTPAPDGLLGKLRFSVDIMRNENYVDPNAKQLDTTYSAEVAIKDVDLKDENWDEYTCYFQPHGEGGLRIQYDPASEDLGVGNPYKFSELLRQAAPLLSSDTAKIGKSLQANSFSVGGAYNILGRTYDLSKVDYFDVRLVSESQGRVYEGQLGKLDRKMERKSGGKAEGSKSKFSLKNPEQCANFRDEKLVLTDRDSKQKATLTFDLNLIGILRADRVRRILADTFRLVGLVFDSRTLNQNSGRYEPEQLQKDVHTFLWDTCRTNVFPGRNIGDELLAQVRIMRHASKLHWKVTPQLLAYVFEVVFVSGEKDRLSYENAVAVDAVLNRWSRVLTQVTEAKDYLTGHLHGKKTPRLIEALFTECEWTGFDILSLRGGLTSSNGDSVGAGRNSEERSSPLHVGDRVTAQLPLFKHAGVPVDVELPGGQFTAAIIAKEWGGGRYDIKLCTGFGMEETVFVCPLHDEKDPEVSNRRVRDIKQGRLAKLKHFDEKEHPESPYLVEYLDHLQPHEEWQPRDSIEATLSQVEGGVLKGQLQKEDYVRVNGGAVVSPEESRDRRHSTLGLAKIDDGVAKPTPQKTSTKTGSTRPARVSHNYGNARYDIVYLDGQQPKDEKLVTRERLLPVTDGIMYDGRVSSVYHPTSRIDDSPSTAKYSTLLESGELVDNLERSQLRTRQKFIAADTALLGSVFSSSLQTLDKTGTQPSSSTTTMADKLNNLWWGSDKIVKVYAMLPSAVKTIQARDATTNKLLQSALVERSEDQPRFLGQYHGFVKGDNFDKAEEEKLELVYTAACKRRMHNTLSNGTLPFSKKNCFYLILAPPPLVQVRGAVTVSSCSDSGPLFKALVLATLGKTPGSAVFILQRLLRAECNIDPQLHRKGRTVMIEAVKVDFNNTPSRSVVVNMMPSPSDNTSVGDNNADLTGVALSNATIEIKFRLSMPHNDHGNISDAVNVSFAQATGISGRLKLKKTLAVEGDKPLTDFGDLGKLPWLLAASEEMIAPSMALSVDFTSAEGRFDSEPEVSLELEPLDDIRVSVRDFDENVHELHFPMYDVLAEARVRRELSPFHKAYIAPGPFATSHCNLQFQKTSANKSPNTAAVKVPRADIKFDKLSVQVLEASNMTLKEKMGTDGLLVEVLLVSSDFRQHMANDKKVTTPFGLALSSTGEILPDADKQIYPKNSVFSLTNDKTAAGTTLSTPLTTSVAWKNKYALQPDSQLKFTYPAIDLDRVSDVKMIVRDKKTNTKIGIVTIPMAKIGVSRSTNNADKPKDEPIFSVHHEGSDRKRVVGTISLSITRMKSYGEKTEVYAKQLEKSMDFWAICPKELLKMTLEQHENKLSRSFLATGPPVSGGGKILLEKSLEMELQLQKITKVRLIFDAMNKLHATTLAGSSTAVVSTPNASNRISTDLTSLAFDQLRLTLQQTKSLVKDTAQELGLIDRRLPWSSDAHGDENDSQLRDNMVIVEANVATCTHRVRHAVLKLYEVFIVHFMPKLNELYILDAKEDRVDVATGEKLLSFFNNEVDELELEDQKVRQRLYQRLRLAKLTQVLDMIMRATVRVKVMDEDRNNVDNYLGTACIPLMDLLDQQPRDDMYQLLYLPTTNLRGYRIATHSPGEKDRGKVRLRLHLKISESSFFEQAINVYKIWKAKYLAQHEAARRRLHAAVVPAQRRRWLTIKGYLDELTKQAQGKLHWERTPVLLSLVWDIFALQESSPTHVKKKAIDAEELEYTQSVAQVANAYRDSVMKVHKRWVNMQPRLEELMTIQAAALIHAQRTPELLDDIEREIEGLDVGLSTAWQQVKQKWQILLNALEELVSMQERKLNLTRAPQLLKIVEQRCSKGLSTRHADAVSNIQSRWMAITQPNGPLSELRLMEKKGLHWRRTHELLLLLDEQCEGFADVDARALNTVQNRWEQVQEWLHEIVEMQQQHSIDCEHTPFILEKMHLWRSMRANRQGELNKPEKLFNPIRAAPPSPKNKDEAGGRPRSLSHQNSSSRVSSDGSIRSDSGAEDNGQLEGMAEWYAIEEAKYELERIPYHRITVDTEKRNWLSYSRDGKDIRLLITQQEMVFTPANVRLALEDRGVIPKTSNFDPTADRNAKGNDSDDAWVSPSLADPKSGSQSVALPKTVLKEIEELEKMLEKHRDDSQQVFALPNPERVAELYQSMKSLGKSDLLWKVDHAVSRNRELAVPENYQLLLKEMTLRQIPTTEVENLVKSLAFTLQKEVLVAKGIAVPTTANPTTLLQLMHRHQVKEVLLPPDTTAIQTLLQERGMDRKGDPVILRGIRIGTQSTGAASDNTSGASSSKALNTGLGIIDTQIEILRKTLLFEALRKRNSLVRTFAGESHVLDDEDERTEADMFAAAVENAEVDVSGDYMTLVERFQRLLVHEAYTKRLAEYAALDRCVRALLGKSRDETVTKEEIAMELHNINKRVIGANYRLPAEAFTKEELKQAVGAGRIRTPSDEMLARCPQGDNAHAMAHYAAISYAANVFQEVTSFRSRVDLGKNRLQDTFPFDECSSVDGVAIPKQWSRWTFSQSIADWLLGFDTSTLSIKRKLSAAHRQRLEWASAAFTLRNRWLQRGLGWCDPAFGEGVGVKILLDRLLLFEAANKMDMVKTEKLLREVRDKCSRLREREQEAQAKLEERYQSNLELLEKLVTHAERCMNNRKLHSEETPVLLHKLEQVCVVPNGLNERHREAYHKVATHWLPQQQHLTELVKMHREGTFSITRTPELLGKMNYHTEGKAGSEELSEDMVAASAQRVAPELQATFVDRKLNEVRLGQRKEASSLRLDLNTGDDIANQSVDDTTWKELSHSKRVAQPLSPHEKHTNWKVVRNAVAANAAFSASSGDKAEKFKVSIEPKRATQLVSPRRKLSLSEELKELLRSPSQWLTGAGPQEESIKPELYFPKEVVLETPSASLTGAAK
ncbi:hypothetical protein PRIC2_008194 [Phytophthora ramorum]